MIEIGVRKIKIFLSVVENESFSKAAKEIYVSQPAITIAINQIEEFFDDPLFVKSNNKTRKAKLTKHGQIIYSIFKEFMSYYNDMIEQVKINMHRDKQKINVFIDGNGMNAINRDFFQILKTEKIDDKIEIVVEKKKNIIDQLSGDRNSLGIVIGGCDFDNVDFVPIDTMPIGIVSNCAIENDSVWDRLHDQTFFIARVDSQTHNSICTILKSRGIDISKAVIVDDINVFLELVSNGPFVGLAPDISFSSSQTKIQFSTLSDPKLTIDFGVAVNKGRLNSAPVQEFVSAFRDISSATNCAVGTSAAAAVAT